MTLAPAVEKRGFSIRAKVLWVLAAVALISVGAVGALSYNLGVTTLETQAFDQLTSVRELKGHQIEDYFQFIVDQAVTLSEHPSVASALADFSEATESLSGELARSGWDRPQAEGELRLYYQDEFLPRLNTNLLEPRPLSDFWPEDETARALQSLYLSSNPYEVGSKHLQDQALESADYNEVHARYHPIFRSYLERFGYYDIFLVDLESGRIVYSVFKEVDFGTSLLIGPYRDSNIADVFRAASESGARDFTTLEDFQPYSPSYSARASFVASPVFDGDEPVGVLIFQLPLGRINDVMTSHRNWSSVGLGQTGETYLVGADHRLRTEPRFLLEDPDRYLAAIRGAGALEATANAIASLGSAIGLQEVRTVGTELALSGEYGTAVFEDYRGVEVFSSFRPLELPGLDWVIMSEIDAAEALAAVAELRGRMLIWIAVLIPLLGLIAFWFAGSLARPIRVLSASAAELAQGHLDIEVDVHRGDEIGELAGSFDQMRRSIQELVDRQNRAIEALSTPIIPLRNDAIMVPLVGELDRGRIANTRARLLKGIHDRGAKVAILDLTGVPSIQSEIAEGLQGTIKAAQLLGCRVIVTGMQAAAAGSLVDAGLDLEGVPTEGTMQAGFQLAMGMLSGKYADSEFDPNEGDGE
jgi:anti-anti-sigma regulatory factor/HAMP domain-containing protein